MPFIVTATGPSGAISAGPRTAKQALEKLMEFEASGFQKITVKDDLGRILTRDQIIMLAAGS